jgi:hypothetical protein
MYDRVGSMTVLSVSGCEIQADAIPTDVVETNDLSRFLLDDHNVEASHVILDVVANTLDTGLVA